MPRRENWTNILLLTKINNKKIITMELYDDEIDLNEVDDIIEEVPSDYFSDAEDETVPAVEEETAESKFNDIIKELKYQLKFSELSRTYIKLNINGKTKKVIPLTEFKKSGTFVLKSEDGSIFQARRNEISK